MKRRVKVTRSSAYTGFELQQKLLGLFWVTKKFPMKITNLDNGNITESLEQRSSLESYDGLMEVIDMLDSGKLKKKSYKGYTIVPVVVNRFSLTDGFVVLDRNKNMVSSKKSIKEARNLIDQLCLTQEVNVDYKYL